MRDYLITVYSVMLHAFLLSVITAGGDVCGEFFALSPGFKFLVLLFNHTMRMMMMTIVTTSSTDINDTNHIPKSVITIRGYTYY